MSLRTCKYCKSKYEDNWSNWVSKFCCISCYRKRVTLFHVGENIYTFDNKMLPKRKGFEVLVTTGTIIKIYEMVSPTNNGFWRYLVKLPDKEKYVERFEHQIFSNLQDVIDYVEKTNKARAIKREANNLLKNI